MALGTKPKNVPKFETRKPPQLEAPKNLARFDSYEQALVAFNNKKLGTLPRPKPIVNGPNNSFTESSSVDSEVNNGTSNSEQDNSEEEGGMSTSSDEIEESVEDTALQDPETVSPAKAINGSNGSARSRKRNS